MPPQRVIRSAGLAAAFLLAGSPASTQTPDAASALVAADRGASEASGRTGFASALLAALSSDGILLWPGAPVVAGPARIRRLLESQRALDSTRITWQPLAVELSADSSVGVTWGVTALSRERESPRLVRYLAAWRREGATWKLAAFAAIGAYPAWPATIPADLGPAPPPLVIRGTDPAVRFIAADIAFARLAGDSGASLAFERYAAPDAVTFGGGILNRGPKAIGNAVRGDRPTHWAWFPVTAFASSSGDFGFTVGLSEIRPEGGAVSYGKYLTIWRRLPSGAVRFITDGGNAHPARP